jgi:hypothetical protein
MQKLFRAESDVRDPNDKGSHPNRLNGVAYYRLQEAQEDMADLQAKHGGNWWVEKVIKVNFGVGFRWVKI